MAFATAHGRDCAAQTDLQSSQHLEPRLGLRGERRAVGGGVRSERWEVTQRFVNPMQRALCFVPLEALPSAEDIVGMAVNLQAVMVDQRVVAVRCRLVRQRSQNLQCGCLLTKRLERSAPRISSFADQVCKANLAGSPERVVGQPQRGLTVALHTFRETRVRQCAGHTSRITQPLRVFQCRIPVFDGQQSAVARVPVQM